MSLTVKTIVALGDSTTAGTPGFKSPLEAPPHGEGDVQSQYAFWLARAHPEWRVLNRGINGERSDQIRARFTRDVIHAGADLVVIIAGVNDIYQQRSAEVVQFELEAMFQLARSAPRSLAVVAGSIMPFNTATPDQDRRMMAVNDWLREYAARHADVAYCDTRAAVSDPADADRLLSSPDDLHPSAEGYRRAAQALEPVIVRTLVRQAQMALRHP
jgi:lysophospholipase L1-like esterase